ncbi:MULTISPECIES: transposase [Bradyrhizobium]|uniref:Tc1-like transposase DDE domain-containing protein n=3 Tax=Bradyrhizobium TaxID=374 RepID=A0AAE5X8Q8_9BRAD|nr:MULTISPECIES: transposase [Bradyrhizobium]QAU50765.1 hypothetical protein XH91_36195 [Bradyrhizobium guangzhouense]QOZ49643.1 hypothetical protein XH89_40065 [Bradyrhizobium sp. CCBAU 53340]QOZ56761.1 hypothetical protein XH90_35855 [Bradyrhizobium sp. CCBAU 53338]QOZ81403.1 hypothetical protein XH83_38995 [Bradyrhizobium sp. CCBAU 53351]MDT4736560.1 transposase [Bradyrhizobium sp. WYCCWR 12699]
MAKASGLLVSTVQRIWRAFGPAASDGDVQALDRPVPTGQGPRRRRLYVSPPQHAIVPCVSDKSQIQALDRSQPMWPMRPGQPARRSHDYKRHGTTSLVAPSILRPDGSSASATDFTAPPNFASSSTRPSPRRLDVHLVMDNYATHTTPLIRRWLVKRPRWHVHLTPTSSSWLNQERFFELLTDKNIRRSVYRSIAAVRADIASFIERHNADPKPFPWTNSIERFCRSNALVQDTRLAAAPSVGLCAFGHNVNHGHVLEERPNTVRPAERNRGKNVSTHDHEDKSGQTAQLLATARPLNAEVILH